MKSKKLREDLITRNENRISNFRRWAFSCPQPIPAIESLPISNSIRVLTKPDIDKACARIMLRMSTKMQDFFKMKIDKIYATPLSIIKAREVSRGIARIAVYTKNMKGMTKKGFDPASNIYIPQTSNSALLQKQSKHVFDEIQYLINSGVLNKKDLSALDAYADKITKLSANGAYDRNINYGALLPKLKEILDESLKEVNERENKKLGTQGAKKSSPQKDEKDSSAVSMNVSEANDHLAEKIENIKSDIPTQVDSSEFVDAGKQSQECPLIENITQQQQEEDWQKIKEIAKSAPAGGSLETAVNTVKDVSTIKTQALK